MSGKCHQWLHCAVPCFSEQWEPFEKELLIRETLWGQVLIHFGSLYQLGMERSCHKIRITSINDNSHSKPGNTQDKGGVWSLQTSSSFYVHHRVKGCQQQKYPNICLSNQKQVHGQFYLKLENWNRAVLPFWGHKSRLVSADPQQALTAGQDSDQSASLWNELKNLCLLSYVYIYPIANYQQALSLSADSCFSSRWWLGSKGFTRFYNTHVYLNPTVL